MNIMLKLTDHPPVPENINEAAVRLRQVLRKRGALSEIEHEAFICAWSAVAYLMPGLHPDESGHDDGGWPVDGGALPLRLSDGARQEK